jgi:D-Tyr-tRNAtyr deacylase
MLDVAIFEKNHRNVNSGCGAFMAAVEVVSQQLFAVGMKNGTTASWEKAVTELAETKFHSMNMIITDRDSAVKSQSFRDSIKERFGISWTHLKSRSKA